MSPYQHDALKILWVTFLLVSALFLFTVAIPWSLSLI